MTPLPQPLLVLPQPGDVLVANLSATTEYDVSTWLTEDRAHFMRLASHR